ncbi:MAG TPA: ABC transporter ATP-binding protein [Cellulomonas sp.]
MSTNDTMLEITDLTVTFRTASGPVTAVDGVSLSVAPGETLALVGESGSGKSTVAFATVGLLPDQATVTGRVRVGSTVTTGATAQELRTVRGAGAAMVFQEPSTALNPLMRVGDQIVEAIRNHRRVTAGEAKERALDLLRQVEIPTPERKLRAYPFELSGGQRQRVVLAMALANSPRLLIADEPTTALDVTVQAEVLDLLRRLAAETGTSILLVTHNMGVVADLADRVAVMSGGQIVETGPVRDVLRSPAHPYTRRLLAAVPRLVVEQPSADHQADDERPEPDDGGPEPVIALRDVRVTFGRGRGAVHALRGIDLTVAPGETLGVVGESGSGKTTAARVVLGLTRPDAGEVRVLGTDMLHGPARRHRAVRRRLGVVLQDPAASLDPRLTVRDCILEPAAVHRHVLADPQRRARELLDAVQLPASVLDRSPYELSGGQRQRVSLARALLLGPTLVVADEPTSALDVSVQDNVLTVLSELQAELGFACLFVSHDLAVVQRVCHRVAVMRDGVVVEQGPVLSTLVAPRAAYTADLLDAVPVADPDLQRAKRERRAARARGAR